MSYNMKYPIVTSFLKSGTGRRPGIRMAGKPRFIVLHDTGNPNSTARGNINYYGNSLSTEAGAQVFIDDKEIIECIPVRNGAPEKAWHVMYNQDRKLLGLGAANDWAIGLEMCYFPGNRTRSEASYQRTIHYAAYIAKLFGMNINNCLIGHEHLDPKRKIDPSNGLKSTGRTYNQMVADIKAVYRANGGSASAKPSFDKNNTSNMGYVTILTSTLNVRRGPGVNHASVKKLKQGSTWKAYRKENGWYNIGGDQWVSGGKSYVQYHKNPHYKKAQSSKPATPNKKEGEKLLELSKTEREEIAKIFGEARKKGIFQSRDKIKSDGQDHEKNIREGKMTVSRAFYLLSIIAGAGINNNKRIQK